MMKTIKFLSLTLLILLVFPVNDLLSHGTAGMTITGTVDGYTGDVDYDYVVVEAEKPGRFVFNLFSGDAIDVAGTAVPFDDLWVRVVQEIEGQTGGKAIFAGPIKKQRFGGTGMVFTLPEAGKYTMFVRYSANDTKIAEVSYPLTVYNFEPEKKFYSYFEFWAGVGGGSLLVILLILPFLIFKIFKNRRKSKKGADEKLN